MKLLKYVLLPLILILCILSTMYCAVVKLEIYANGSATSGFICFNTKCISYSNGVAEFEVDTLPKYVPVSYTHLTLPTN